MLRRWISLLWCVSAMASADPVWLIVGSDGGYDSVAGRQQLQVYLQQQGCPLVVQWQRDLDRKADWQWLFAPQANSIPTNAAPLLVAADVVPRAQVVTRHYSDIQALSDVKDQRIAVVRWGNDTHQALMQVLGERAGTVRWREGYSAEVAVGLLIHQEVDAALIQADLAQQWAKPNGLRLVTPEIAIPQAMLWVKGPSAPWQEDCVNALTQLRRTPETAQMFRVFPRWFSGFKRL